MKDSKSQKLNKKKLSVSRTMSNDSEIKNSQTNTRNISRKDNYNYKTVKSKYKKSNIKKKAKK